MTVEELRRIRERVRDAVSLEDGRYRTRVTIHMGTCGIAAGAEKIKAEVQRLLAESGAEDISLTVSGCAGLCSREPMATVERAHDPPVKYVDLNEAKVRAIYQQHVVGGRVVTEYAMAVGCEQRA